MVNSSVIVASIKLKVENYSHNETGIKGTLTVYEGGKTTKAVYF